MRSHGKVSFSLTWTISPTWKVNEKERVKFNIYSNRSNNNLKISENILHCAVGKTNGEECTFYVNANIITKCKNYDWFQTVSSNQCLDKTSNPGPNSWKCWYVKTLKQTAENTHCDFKNSSSSVHHFLVILSYGYLNILMEWPKYSSIIMFSVCSLTECLSKVWHQYQRINYRKGVSTYITVE